MCGRFSLTQSASTIAKAFDLLPEMVDWQPRYNIAPTQQIAAIVHAKEDQATSNSSSHEFQFKTFQWGLIPSWSKDPTIGSKLMNARAETLAEKPSFREAFKRRRCLILADGFYEWKNQGGKKQPFYFQLKQRDVFAFAGLWESWRSSDDREMRHTCIIITTDANAIAATVHNRMPVMLEQHEYDRWLDPTIQNPNDLQSLLDPYQAEAMTMYPVSIAVNRPTYDRPDCIQQLMEV